MQIEEFLKSAHQFKLGHLDTERRHPETWDLDQLANTDLTHAVRLLKSIDLNALQTLISGSSRLNDLRHAIHKTLQNGHRIYLSGCGATGRLALSLESLWRKHQPGVLADQVIAFMAGGDFALVKSVENFEDHPEYGARQLAELGFQDGDLLIGITEGGETPFVLGTIHKALELSHQSPWFVACNPAEQLRSIDRSKEVLEHPRIESWLIPTGPMALAGSTRLQAATVQMLGIGTALFDEIESLFTLPEKIDSTLFHAIVPWVEWESSQYRAKKSVLFETPDLGIAVLTDTTERSPTFSLTPFETGKNLSDCSWVYLCIPQAETSLEAWEILLQRKPRGLTWDHITTPLDTQAITEFDFSNFGKQQRLKRTQSDQSSVLHVHHQDSTFVFWADRLHTEIVAPQGLTPLQTQVLFKMILNIGSLLIMGRMGRYESNVMTWVRPSNGKLIDRTVRTLQGLIQHRGWEEVSETTLIHMIYDTLPTLKSHQAVVNVILDKISSQSLTRPLGQKGPEPSQEN